MFSKRMRGLEVSGGDEDEEDLEFERDLRQSSLISAINIDRDETEVRFLDFGIKVNDSLELLLSGFFLNSLEASGPSEPISNSASVGPSEVDENGGGVRLAAILSPLEWLKMIPSVTQIEGDRDNGRRSQQKLGLETWMILPTSRVAVFMAAHAMNQDDLFDRPLGFSPDWQTMDMALGLHYYLSDSLRFSLWGSYAYNPDTRTSEDSGRRTPSLDEMSFQLNFKF